MKKVTKKINLKNLLGVAALCFGLNQTSVAQCSAAYTYTANSSGISVTNTSTGTDSHTLYNWSLNNNYFNGSSPSFGSLYNGSYVLTLSLSSNDSSNTCNSSTTQTITVSGGQNAPTCSASYSYVIGSAGQVTFANTSPTDPYNNNSYSWNFDNSNMTSSAENPTYTYYYNGTYYVVLSIYNAISGCSTSTTQTITITNAQAAPSCNASFTYTVGTVGTVSFTNTYSGTAPGITYNWSFGNGAGNSGQNVTYTYPYNGVYTVTAYVSDSLNQCSSTTTQTVSITNTATQPCVPSVSFNMHQDSINPQPGIWEASASYSSQVTSAIWSWGDGSSTNGLSPTHTYTAAGHYNICVRAIASCGDTSAAVCQNDSLYRTNGANSVISVTVINTTAATGIKTTTEKTAQVSIYPNPSAGVFTLNLTNVAEAKAQINITNILGEVIYSTQEQVNNGIMVKQIDLENTANGAYFMRVSVNSQAYTSKIIINK
jgi:PKD repeat protein